MNLPATFTRTQVIAAFDALGLTGPDAEEEIAELRIIGTQVELDLFVHADEGGVINAYGENATVTVTIPVDEDA